ncbi:probable disease resistance RPP8-like protein 2 [Salvia splendens]|uniref:probable disease resistance RPP8-like protein 2 n=1 Tax=Salvia splendens TaxID=180675 RepID=UPI001C269221|nr:probable disease resistance RPP8-like protein 2 [Salvia splendens]
MAEYVVFCVIRSLSELLLYEARHIPELRSRIEVIQMKLRQLQSILEIADARQEIDEGIRNWIAETREAAYDIEDLLLVVLSSSSSSSSSSSASRRRYTGLFREATSLHSLEPKIQLIEAKVSALESDLRVRNIRPRQRGSPNPIARRRLQQRRTYSHFVEDDLVGLDDHVEQLVSRLVSEDADQVVSITGMGGIGKTTLAKRIYHHHDVRGHFHALAWACVSQQGQPDDVLQRILNKLEPEKKKAISIMKIDDLVEELIQVQRRKRCLVVLDDVWDMDAWDLVFKPVFVNRQASRIVNMKVLLTTRNKEIARYIDLDAPCYLYEQRHLDQEESWELLNRKVSRNLSLAGISLDRSLPSSRSVEEPEYSSGFEDEDALSRVESFRSCYSDEEDELVSRMTRIHSSSSEDTVQDLRNQMDMERLGKEMVAQCGGLPLAIVVLGGLLMTKSTISEWRTVHQNFNSYLRRGRTSRENGRVHEVLALSYHDLPYQLKPCFLHLGNFPEDHKIPTRKLYQLWLAEGFISQESEEGESIMDVAERYLVELVQRCMVQVRADEVTGKFKSCQLHDLTRELCLVKGKEENFLKRIPIRYEPELLRAPSPSSIAPSISKTRRLSIAVDCDFDTYFPPRKEILEYRKENLERVRSALFFSRLSNRKNLHLALDFVCSELKLIRVLDLERFDFGDKLCKGIGDLIHLRYLSLRGCQLNKLSSSIGNLKYLQSLDLRVPFLVCMAIPNVIWKLNHLKHLYLPPSHECSSKLQLHSLSKLEILKNFDSRVSDYRDLTKLTKLQKLAAILSLEIDHLAALFSHLKMDTLHIKDSSFRIRYDFQSEKELTALREIVGSVHLQKLDLIGIINKLPEQRHFGRSLMKLTLRSSKLKEDPMTTLEKLPNLHTLILRKNAFAGNAICCSSEGFPSLTVLELQGLTDLEKWRIDEGAMPNLYCLKIDECIKLRMVPEGVRFIASLRELVIVNMLDSFKSRVQKVQEQGGKDTHIVGHIPSITIADTNRTYMKKFETQLSGKSYNGLFQSFSPLLVPRDWQKS